MQQMRCVATDLAQAGYTGAFLLHCTGYMGYLLAQSLGQ